MNSIANFGNLLIIKEVIKLPEKKVNSSNLKNLQPPYEYPHINEDEIDLYELWLILKKHTKCILGTLTVFLIIALIYILISPPVYKTETTIYPLQEQQKSSLSTLAGNIGISLPTFLQSLTVEAVLKSNTVKELLINKLNLMPLLFESEWDNKTQTWKDPKNAPTILDGIEKLDDLISTSTDKKTGVITISVEFPKDPKMAYLIAKTLLEETNKILNEKNWNLAKKHRIFIENQLKDTIQKLKILEKLYKDFLAGKIKEVPIVIDLSLLKSNKNATLNLNSKEIKKLRQELRQIKTSKVQNQNLPDYQFNLQKLQMQMNLMTNLLNYLAQQYETAKAQEIKENITFQVIDPPYVPDKRKPYKPKKVLILAVAGVTGLFLGIFLAFFREWLENVKRQREEQV